MSQSGRALISSGAILGVAIALIGLFMPGGALSFYLHARTALLGLPLSAALMASGAVLGRLDRERVDYGE